MSADHPARQSLDAASRTGGKEAVCFTAGPAGAVFAIGAIHAWLAADRLPPQAAAGISWGSITAAAMQRSYREIESLRRGKVSPERLESARWNWFRKYLGEMSDAPLDVIWKAFPDPIDFFADKPPVRDLSGPEVLAGKELESRKHYFRLTKLGIWLGRLPIRISTVASLITHYVRAKERYAVWPLQWCFAAWHAMKIGAWLLLHIATTPLFLWEAAFSEGHTLTLPWPIAFLVTALLPVGITVWAKGHPFYGAGLLIAAFGLAIGFVRNRSLLGFRPLLGWKTWLTAVGQIVSLLLTVVLFAWWRMTRPHTSAALLPMLILSAAIALVILTAILIQLCMLFRIPVWGFRKEMKGEEQALGAGLLKALGIESGLLRHYELHKRLLQLFGEIDAEGQLKDAPISNNPMHVVIVASPLEGIPKGRGTGFEAVAAEGKENLVEALRAALATPGLFPPVAVDPEKWGVDPDKVRAAPGQEKKLHLVDGAVFRQNPLPRFLSWLGHQDRSAVPVDSVRLLYSVPIEPKKNAPDRETVNIFDAASESLKLEKRRDTRQQARQVRFLTELQRVTGPGTSRSGRRTVAVDVTEIAPEDDISFSNGLDPRREEVLRHAANGCRKTLEALYGPDQAEHGKGIVHCSNLLLSIAPARTKFISFDSPGLPEICARCEQYLSFRKLRRHEAPDPGVERNFGTLKRTDEVKLHALDHKYARLNGDQPATVVLASGGVFRGVTHIGFIGALAAAGIRPDLVIGSSVGALMGAALCALCDMPPAEQKARLRLLTDLFLHVDQRVALTRPLKNALKQLGIRARRIHLSPARIRSMLRKGATADAGYAATGAPPALIDAISDLFLIPHQETSAIACEFVAGHFAKAAKFFWEQVQKETLRKLDIETALMGTSLLEARARELMRPYGSGPGDAWYRTTQPYQWSKFFCVTADLNHCGAMLLGRDSRTVTEVYDFVEACLSSSAFPTVFSPRSESQVLPGAGRTNVLFSDGGMFDNLPIFPAIELMNKAQMERTAGLSPQQAIAHLDARSKAPHLFIAAALDAEADKQYTCESTNLSRIYKRAQSLKAQVKSQEFENSAQAVCDKIRAYLDSHPRVTDCENLDFLNSVVVAEILRIVPSDKDHINPTFAFCSSAGLKQERVEKAIANGCFRTLLQIATGQADKTPSALKSISRLPAISRVAAGPNAATKCAHFSKDGGMDCPFADVHGSSTIRLVCATDPKHVEDLNSAFNISPP